MSSVLKFSPSRGLQQQASGWGEIARPFGVKIFSDFDGTISKQDSLKMLLERHGSPEWRGLERALKEGRIAESQALPQMFVNFPLLPQQAQAEVLASVELDPSFVDFAHWCLEQGHELTILSGGFRSFILPLLNRYGLGSLKVIANDVRENSQGGWTIQRAPIQALCSLCTHCKSSSLLSAQKAKDLIVYIGDGHTDFCPVQLSHLVFAKATLKDFCLESGQSFLDFQSFEDVLVKLETTIQFLSEGVESPWPQQFLKSCEDRFGYSARQFMSPYVGAV